MKFLLDTHLLIWAAARPERLSRAAVDLIENPDNEPMFSVASLWEVSIKYGLGREDFTSDPRLPRRELRENGYDEVPVTSAHVLAALDLPRLHQDPFDRIRIAQSAVEGIVLLTADPLMARYQGLVRHV